MNENTVQQRYSGISSIDEMAKTPKKNERVENLELVSTSCLTEVYDVVLMFFSGPEG